MTTAYHRTLAHDLAARCEWGRAAEQYQRAIDLYPETVGEFAKADLATLATRRDECSRAALAL